MISVYVLIESINFSSIYMLNCILHAYHYFSSKLPRGSYRKVGFDFLFFLSSSTHLIRIERIKVLQLKLEIKCLYFWRLKEKKKLFINQLSKIQGRCNLIFVNDLILTQLIGRIFSPSQKLKKLSHPFWLCFELGLGIHVHHAKY